MDITDINKDISRENQLKSKNNRDNKKTKKKEKKEKCSEVRINKI